MGPANDPMAVVDPECRVFGVDGLRVADSSVFSAHHQWKFEWAINHERRKSR